jgi:hypothetical protein
MDILGEGENEAEGNGSSLLRRGSIVERLDISFSSVGALILMFARQWPKLISP